MNYYYLFLIVALLIVSCTREKKMIEHNPNMQDINIDVKTENDFRFSLLYDSCDVIILKTSEKNLGGISKIRVDNSNLYILSMNKLYLFNNQGEFINVYDKKGKGPDEYLNIEDFIVTKDNIQFIDFNQKKIVFLDRKLYFIKSIQIDFYASSFFMDDNKTYIFNHNSSGYSNSNFKISIRDSNLKVKNGYFPMSDVFMHYYYVIEQNNYCKVNNSVHLLHSPYDTIYQINKTNIVPVYALNFGSYKMPFKNYEKRYDDIYEFYLSSKNSNSVCYIDSYFENNNSLFFSYSLNGNRKHVFFNKKDGKILNSSEFIDDINFQNFRFISAYDNYPKAITNTHHYYAFQAYDMIDRIKKNKVKNKSLLELKNRLNIYSNPIILKMKLK
jgi:hypothetical protein